MALTFYYGSGSPPAWKVWLALEHKQIPYHLELLSFQAGDLNKPAYLAINPRHKVPAIVDDGFALYESSTIIEYLEERYPDSGERLWPRDLKQRAHARRVAEEVENYLYTGTRRLMQQTLFRPKDDGDPKEIAAAREALIEELALFEAALDGELVAGTLSAADFALYPQLALIRRLGEKSRHGVNEYLGHKLKRFMARIEALPYLEKTVPPHWKG